MSRVSKLKTKDPELLEDQDFKELVESADKIHAVKVIADQEGGKALIDYLVHDIVNGIHYLTAHADSATHFELVATLSRMKANIATVRFLTTAKGDVAELDKQIEERLRE